MYEDILLRTHRDNPGLDVQYSEDIFNEALISLENMCMSINKKIVNQFWQFSLERDRNKIVSRDVFREKRYDVDAL